MSNDLVTEAHKLATEKVQLIKNLSNAQSTLEALERARTQLQRVDIPDRLDRQHQRTIAEFDDLISEAKSHVSDELKAARTSWPKAELQRLGLVRAPRRTAHRRKDAPSVPAAETASALQHQRTET